jgi:hypothetical protein
VLARAGPARHRLCAAIGLTLADVRIVRSTDNLHGAYNGTLYVSREPVYSGAFSRIIKAAKRRGFKVEHISLDETRAGE